jgi:hypothetical protein
MQCDVMMGVGGRDGSHMKEIPEAALLKSPTADSNEG